MHAEAADLVVLRKLQAEISLELLKSFKKLPPFFYLFYVKIFPEGISCNSNVFRSLMITLNVIILEAF